MNMQSPPASSMWVIKRNGERVPFNQARIERAIRGTMVDAMGDTLANSASGLDQLAKFTSLAVNRCMKKLARQESIHVEDIQDLVELTLMTEGEHKLARMYITYRDAHAKARNPALDTPELALEVQDGADTRIITQTDVMKYLAWIAGSNQDVDISALATQALRDGFKHMQKEAFEDCLVLAARSRIEMDPAYGKLAMRLVLEKLYRTVLTGPVESAYTGEFCTYIARGVSDGLLASQLQSFDLPRLAQALKPERDHQFKYLGIETVRTNYLLRGNDNQIIELPQWFFMRVAMGLSLNEQFKEERAIEFYNVLSSFDAMSATPTLFNSGTNWSQLSSCYLTTVPDDLDGIFEAFRENALLSKYAGGLGNDWTRVRALGSRIKGTNGESQGIVPFLKIANDTAVAVNQSGKRKGAVCAYLETWHLDIEEFLDLRKNTGDDRRRTHDMNTAHWIPDLFMKRVQAEEMWTLFSPDEVPDLHDLTGKAFEQAYTAYEEKAATGQMRKSRQIPAVTLWRKMLQMLFETGHPWITFKDPCNVRSPQQHAGVVHSSNLCTEITLNTGPDEIAVCNLASVNLAAHIEGEGDDAHVNVDKLRRTVTTVMRMLDNVIDINYYAVEKARNANMRHRPVGMGVMGYQDAMYRLNIQFGSKEAVAFADSIMEQVCYFAYSASSDLAAERGSYASFQGSLWSKGILPIDSIQLLTEARGGFNSMDTRRTLDWGSLAEKIARQGMRNSNCVAIAPTATISNIVGVSACIEPTFLNLSVKSNLAGEFTMINEYLVDDLKALGLWDKVMLADLKHFDGSVQRIDRIPLHLREKYRTAFEIDQTWVIEQASRRQKWIDQGQSVNVWMASPSGKKLDALYKHAWERGLKTTYYLRTLGKSSAEKSTGTGGELNAVAVAPVEQQFCALDGTGCEACQ